MVRNPKHKKSDVRHIQLRNLSKMISRGRWFKWTSEGTLEISTEPRWYEAHLKRVVIELSKELGFGKLEDCDLISEEKDRGDLREIRTGRVIEIEHEWRNFIKHGHDRKKIDVLILGPDSPKIPDEFKKRLPKEIIYLTDDHVQKWRDKTRGKRKVITVVKKLEAALYVLNGLILEGPMAALLQSEEGREMLPEIYLEEEISELTKWAEKALDKTLRQKNLEGFLDRFITDTLTDADVSKFWERIDSL